MVRKYITGKWSVVIMRGKFLKHVLQKTSCIECSAEIGYYAEKPRPDRKNLRCENCLNNAIVKACKTHTEEMIK